MRVRDHRDLLVWQKGMDLVVAIYELTRRFPASEEYGLSTQMRRASVSIVSNIAEGAARRTTKDFLSFLHIARGSLAELETQVLLVERLGIAADDRHLIIRLDDMGRLINGMIRSLQTKIESKTHRR